jgi:lipopolysaccharide transport system permease protein
MGHIGVNPTSPYFPGWIPFPDASRTGCQAESGDHATETRRGGVSRRRFGNAARVWPMRALLARHRASPMTEASEHPSFARSLSDGSPHSSDSQVRLRYSWDLVMHLVGREFRLRYRRALFGWLWALGSPLARLVILTYVFTRVLPLGIDNYPIFAFTGLIAWQWFAGGITSATTSAVDRRDLLFRPGLPRSSVPIVSVLTDGLDYLASLPVLLLFLLIGDGIPLTALALPAVLFCQFLLTVGMGFALCTANVFVRDINLFVGMAVILGWYVTPVFYDASAVPQNYRFVLDLNPMAHLLGVYRAVLIEGRLPGAGSFLLLIATCSTVFVAGYLVYRKVSPVFVDEL